MRIVPVFFSIIQLYYIILKLLLTFHFICFFSVAHGACVQAAVLKKKKLAPLMYVRNVIPLTIGIIGPGRKCRPVFQRNTSIPTSKTIYGSTIKNNQKRAFIVFVEGEQPDMTTNGGNLVLGEMVLEGLAEAKCGEGIVKMNVRIDENCTISAKAICRKSLNHTDIEIKRTSRFTSTKLIEMAASLSKLEKGGEIENAHKIHSELYHFDSTIKRKKYEENDELEVESEICPVYGKPKIEDNNGVFELGDE